MTREEAILYLEHTSGDDFNLEEHQIQNRLNAIQFLLKENQDLKEKFKATNKGLQKVVLKRKKWKHRYQLARCEIKELERIIELCHLDAKETLATINYEQENQQKEFIKFLENELLQARYYARDIAHYIEYVLRKYKEKTQTKNDKSV